MNIARAGVLADAPAGARVAAAPAVAVLAATLLASTLLAAIAHAQPRPACFENAGLKDLDRVTYMVNGARVSGEFEVRHEYDPGKREVYPFNGIISGALLAVQFNPGRVPEALPPRRERHVWALATVEGKASLRVEQFGRNYETQEFHTYTAEYLPCRPDHATLLRSAQRVVFPRNGNSALFAAGFRATSEYRAYLLKLGKSQSVSVQAAGCNISFFYPDRSRHDETAVDRLSIPALPQGGDYLFVISPAGAPGRCEVRFSAQ